jgi:hypothetical protein
MGRLGKPTGAGLGDDHAVPSDKIVLGTLLGSLTQFSHDPFNCPI